MASNMDKKDDKKVIKQLVDIETGELIEIKDGDRLKIITQKQADVIQKSYKNKELNKDMKLWNKELGGFIFVLFKYSNEIFKHCEEITQSDIAKLFYIATFVDYDGCLIYNNNYVKRKNLQQILEINRKHFDTFFNKMVDAEIITYDKNNNIMINKEYFARGNISNEVVEYINHTRLYIRSIQYLYKHVPKAQHNQIGNYFRLIPYIHRQRNILCNNPDSMPEDAEPLTVYDLQQILGCHRHTARKFITDMLKVRLENDEAIIGFWRTDYDEGYSKIIVNPKVFYGGNFNIKGGRQEIIRWFERK